MAESWYWVMPAAVQMSGPACTVQAVAVLLCSKRPLTVKFCHR